MWTTQAIGYHCSSGRLYEYPSKGIKKEPNTVDAKNGIIRSLTTSQSWHLVSASLPLCLLTSRLIVGQETNIWRVETNARRYDFRGL